MKIDVLETDGMFDLDLRVHTETTPAMVGGLWSMTDDGCNATCQSACTPSCTDNVK